MLQICKDLFDAWNTNVRYCHWKSNEHLMQGLDGDTDLDVYVFPEDKTSAEKQLVKYNYIKMLPQECHRYPMVDEWLGFDYETGKLIHIHLHYQIITGTTYCKEFIFPIDDIIIETRVLDNTTGVYVTKPELEIIILYARIALKAQNHNNIKPAKDQKKEIDYLKQSIDFSILSNFCVRLLGDYSVNLYELIIKETLTTKEWKAVYNIAYNWLSSTMKFSRFVIYGRYNYYKFYNRVAHYCNKKYNTLFINKKTIPTSNTSICFLGQDGSGKSTVSIEIQKWLNWKLSANRFYLGSGDHFHSVLKSLLGLGARILKKNKKGQKTTANIISKTHNVKQKPFEKLGLIPKVAAIMDSINRKNVAKRALKEVRRSSKYAATGAISLYDRFPQNQFHGIYDGPKIRYTYGDKNYIISMLAKREEQYVNAIQLYQPSLVFKLLLPPEESIRRKPFENLENVKEKHEITKKLNFDTSEVHVIDATQNYEQELIQIKRIIWEHLVTKCK